MTRYCGECNYTDGMVYTSLPSQVKCTITNKYHFCNYVCDVDFMPVVRCKDCNMWDENNKHGGDRVFGDLVAPCKYFSNGDEYIVYTKPNDYCSKSKCKESEK